jgi:hypothetical protein
MKELIKSELVAFLMLVLIYSVFCLVDVKEKV